MAQFNHGSLVLVKSQGEFAFVTGQNGDGTYRVKYQNGRGRPYNVAGNDLIAPHRTWSNTALQAGAQAACEFVDFGLATSLIVPPVLDAVMKERGLRRAAIRTGYAR